MAKRVRYIKISKIDENGIDQTPTLSNLTQIKIPWDTTSNSTKTFYVENITQYSTYFLYQVKDNNTISGTTITNNKSTIEYNFSASVAGGSGNGNITLDVISDNLGYYDNVNKQYLLQTYPQKPTLISCSGSITNIGSEVDPYTLGIGLLRENSLTPITLTTASIPADSTTTFHLSHLFNPLVINNASLPGDRYFLFTQPPSGLIGNTGLHSFSPDSYFTIESDPSSSIPFTSIPEPYLAVDYSRATDCQPLYGNAIENQTSYNWQQVDYTQGLNTPTNFDLIISGSALKAQVQDSNYTSLRHITPRYLGSKNQSELLNEWTDSEFNIGTYGNTPSVDYLNTNVGYVQWIGGWPPEKSNASNVRISNLINEDGELLSPNLSKNYLQNLQSTFRSGDEVIFTSLNTSASFSSFTRKVIRGGQRLEPYFYNQYEFLERDGVASFTSSINFEEFLPTNSTINENFTAQLITETDLGSNGIFPGDWYTAQISSIISSGSDATNGEILPTGDAVYTITAGSPGLLDTNIQSLNFTHSVRVLNAGLTGGSFYIRLVKVSGGITTELGVAGGVFPSEETPTYTLNVNVPLSSLIVGDELKIQYLRGQSSTLIISSNPILQINQTPLPTPPLTVSGSTLSENLFQYYTPSFPDYICISDINLDGSSNPNTSGEQFFSFTYPNQQIRQSDIPNSGYENISLPVEFKIGDEVRFEGDKIFRIEDVSFINLPTLNFLFIKLNAPISGSGIDINQFSFTRYIDDPNAIIIEGYRPGWPSSPSDEPYIIKPKYITDKLENNLDKYIEDFTNKGLF